MTCILNYNEPEGDASVEQAGLAVTLFLLLVIIPNHMVQSFSAGSIICLHWSPSPVLHCQPAQLTQLCAVTHHCHTQPHNHVIPTAHGGYTLPDGLSGRQHHGQDYLRGGAPALAQLQQRQHQRSCVSTTFGTWGVKPLSKVQFLSESKVNSLGNQLVLYGA
jgi:hypothetical protein